MCKLKRRVTMKKILLTLAVLLLLTGCGSTKEIEKNITSDNIVKEEVIDNVTVKVDKFYYKEGYTTMNLIIKNNKEESIYIDTYKVNLYDKENNLIGVFNPKFDNIIKSKEEVNQMFSIEGDYQNTDRISFEFNL